MNPDTSLSDSLGPLRIANLSDDDRVASPTSTSPDPRPPPSSAHSSASTIAVTGTTDARRSSFLPQLPHESAEQEAGLGFNPESYNLLTQDTAPSPASSQTTTSSQQRDPPRARLNHRASMPLAHQNMQYPNHSPGYSPQMRAPGVQNASMRPNSGIYSQQNNSSSSEMSSHGSYRYRDEMGSSDGAPGGLGRSKSQSARQMMGSIPARETSRTYRPQNPQMAGNGPLPPRRNSKRSRATTSSAVPPPGHDGGSVPFAGSASVPRTTAEWQERGAAVIKHKDPETNQPRVIKKGVKDFSFGRTLGEGSYSTVMAATDRQNLKEYAIKVLDKRHIIKEKKVKYVNIERDTLNRLGEHPGIVRLYYTFQDERSLYFVLDLASGGELLGVLKKLGSFDVPCTRFYAAEILDSIAYMHSRGVIHRDLKPENVLLDREMHVKITDFGTAKILPEPRAQVGNTLNGNVESSCGAPTDGAETDRANSFVGTAEYVSPELLRDKNACKASDLWAFGCIVYQLLAGRPALQGRERVSHFSEILALDYTFPEGFPELARDLVERLLVLEPASRLPIEHIRTHRFFEGVSWGKTLWRQKSPAA